MEKNIEELTLLLIYLTSWEEIGYGSDELGNPTEENLSCSWKGYNFDILNELTFKGYLYPTNHKNKQVVLTKAGEKLAKELERKYIRYDTRV